VPVSRKTGSQKVPLLDSPPMAFRHGCFGTRSAVTTRGFTTPMHLVRCVGNERPIRDEEALASRDTPDQGGQGPTRDWVGIVRENSVDKE
jgi:hypothetical protein